MKIYIVSLIAFIIGTIFGGRLVLHACYQGLSEVKLEAVAERAVRDVTAAYEIQLNKSGIVTHLENKFDDCVKDNSKLQRRVWKLEHPEIPCKNGCEVY